MPAPVYSSPEALEQRIAPASLVLTSATNENEKITITTSKGSLADLTSAVTGATIAGTQFVGAHPEFSIDFTGHTAFRGTNLTITTSGGATFALRELDASGFNLGTVSIAGGETGMIVAGAGSSAPALRSLQVDSLGYGTALHSEIKGPVSTVHLLGDLNGTLELTSAFGALGRVTVGGKLAGGATAESGSLITSRGIGSLTVTGDLIGGDGERSGGVYTDGGSIGTAAIHSMLGGSGLESGSLGVHGSIRSVLLTGELRGDAAALSSGSNARISAAAIGSLIINGGVTGGSADASGSVTTKLGLGRLMVSGALMGGAGLESGAIGSTGAITSATLGSLAGGSGERSGSLLGASFGSVVVNGNVTGGSGANSGNIASGGLFRSLALHGTLTGGSGEESGAVGSKGAFLLVSIDGNVAGGVGEHSGRVVSASTLGTVVVTGNLKGGDGTESGAVGALGNLRSVTVHGQIFGGGGTGSGSILGAREVTSVLVDGTVAAGTGESSGGIFAIGRLASVTLHGSLDGRLGGIDSAQVHSNTAIGSLTVDGSVIGGRSSGAGSVYAFGPISSVTVGGSLDGSPTSDSARYGGSVYTLRPSMGNGEGSVPAPLNPLGYSIGEVHVGEALFGGTGPLSGSLISHTTIGTVVIGGNQQEARAVPHATGPSGANPEVQSGLFGGTGGTLSGTVLAGGNIGQVLVLSGDLVGGGAFGSGSIQSSSGRVEFVFIEGAVRGGFGADSGSIRGASIGTVRVFGDVTGRGNDSGSIIATGTDIDNVFIGGTLANDNDSEEGTPTRIAAQRNIGLVSAFSINGGGLDGGVTISAGGNGAARTAAEAVAIGAVRTTAALSFTDILAGYAGEDDDAGGTVDGLLPVNGHVSIGTVEAGSGGETTAPWQAVNVLAGVSAESFQSVDLAGGNARLPAVIASVIVHGAVTGNTSNGPSYFVIADEFRAGNVGGMAVPLHPGPHNDSGQLDPTNASTDYFEIGTSMGNP